VTRTAIARLFALLTLPGKVVEEAIHALVMWPWADRVHVLFGAEGGAEVIVDLPPSTPDWAVVASSLAPMTAGILSGVVLIHAHLATGITPTGLNEWAVATIVAIWWGQVTLPSPLDRDTATDAAEGAVANGGEPR